MQVWRQEGIVFARGLSFGQRVSYLATMLAYFEAGSAPSSSWHRCWC